MSFVTALTSVILPVLAIAGVGFVLGRARDIEVDALGTVTIYVLAPALVFTSLATTTLGGNAIAKIIIGVVGFTSLMALIGEAVAYAIGEQSPFRDALVLTSAFTNAGNYGVPLSAFAFGAVGRSTAVLFLTVQSTLMYTLGVYLASRSSTEQNFDSVRKVLGLPLVYAVLAAGLARYFDVVPAAGSSLMRALTLTGNAAIPVMLLMLGIQLANTNYGAALSRVRAATTLRVAVAPVVALGVALALNFENPSVGRTFVLECAMPAAVTPLVLVVEFQGQSGEGITAAEYVSTAIMVTTLLSVPVLAILVTLLQSGLLL